MPDILGIKKAMVEALDKLEFPDTFNLDLNALKNNVLDYVTVHRLIKDMEDNMVVMKGLPEYLGNLSKMTINCDKHVIAGLKEYASVLALDIKVDNFGEYTEVLRRSLAELKSVIEKGNPQKLTGTVYKPALQKLGIKFGASNSNFVGDVLLALNGAIAVTEKKVNEIASSSKTDEDKYEELIGLFKVEKQSKAKKFLKMFSKFSRKVSLAAAGAKGRAISSIKNKIASIIVEERLEPVEPYDFSGCTFLSIPIVHIIRRIVVAYKTALGSYPKSTIDYVRNCKDFIKKFLPNLDNYEANFKIYTNPKKSRVDRIKAKQNMIKALKVMQEGLEAATADGNNSLFVLVDGKVNNSRSDDAGEDRSIWFPDATKSDDKKITNVDGNSVVIKGLSFGDFLCRLNPVFKSSVENFDSSLAANVGANGASKDSKKVIAEITEMLKESISFNKKVENIYKKVNGLSLSERKSNELAGSYDEFGKTYGSIKKFPITSVVDEGARKRIQTALAVVDNSIVLINDKNSVNKLVFKSSGPFSQFVTSEIRDNGFNWWEKISDYCGECFKNISEKAQKLISTCENLIKNVPKKGAKSKKIAKASASSGTTEKPVNAQKTNGIKDRIVQAKNKQSEQKIMFDSLKKKIDEESLKVYVKASDKKDFEDHFGSKGELDKCEKLQSAVDKSLKELEKVKVKIGRENKLLIQSGVVDDQAQIALSSEENGKKKQDIDKYLAGIEQSQTELVGRLENLEAWIKKTVEKKNNPIDSPEVEDQAEDTAKDEFKGKIEKAVKDYKVLLQKMPTLATYKKEFDLTAIRWPSGKGDTLVEQVENGQDMWKKAKLDCENCDKCEKGAKKAYNKLVKIKVELTLNPEKTLKIKLLKEDGSVADEVISDNVVKKSKDEVEKFVSTLTNNTSEFSKHYESLKTKIGEMNKKVNAVSSK